VASISRAMAKAAAARLRRLGALNVSDQWETRASICETCPLRRVYRNISYCGNPYIHEIDRDESTQGCGCPCRDKAKSPNEHCPIDRSHRPAARLDGACNCKWCGSRMVAA
jgi:hypothetical protein